MKKLFTVFLSLALVGVLWSWSQTQTRTFMTLETGQTVTGVKTFNVQIAASGSPNIGASGARFGTIFGTTLDISGAGPHAIGGGTDSFAQLVLKGTFSPTGGAHGFRVAQSQNVPANEDGFGVVIVPSLVEAGSGTHAEFAAVRISPPTITAGAAALTNASTVKITGAPTGATNNRALWVTGGQSTFPAGSAALPAVVFETGSFDSGIFSPGVNLLGFSTNGNEAIRIQTNQHVSMGTMTDSGQVTVKADAAGTKGLVVDSAASPTANIQEWTVNGAAATTLINELGRLEIPIIATASLPAVGAAQDGQIIIEDGGAGDRNVIIYAGGERFRIDGGAAF